MIYTATLIFNTLFWDPIQLNYLTNLSNSSTAANCASADNLSLSHVRKTNSADLPALNKPWKQIKPTKVDYIKYRISDSTECISESLDKSYLHIHQFYGNLTRNKSCKILSY